MPRVKIHLTDEDCRLIGELRDQGIGWFEIAQRVGYWFEWTQPEYEAWCRANGVASSGFQGPPSRDTAKTT